MNPQPNKLLSINRLAHRIDRSATMIIDAIAAGRIAPDFEAGTTKLFREERLPELKRILCR